MWNKIQRIYVGDHYQVYPKWTPWANTFGYYTFDNQNASQITDFSGNNRNLTWWTMPSYTLVGGSNYAGNYTNVSSGVAPSLSYSTLGWNFTMLVWVKPTASSQSYASCLHGNTSGNLFQQKALIWNYNSWKFEYYDSWKNNWTSFTYRTEILSGVSLNTWHLIGYSHTNSGWTSTIQVYGDGVTWNSVNSITTSVSFSLYLWSSNAGDRLKWQIWECVVENRVRTAQEVADYYNQTKATYQWFN